MAALAIVLAGGSGSRMGIDRNKVYVTLAGRPVLAWSLATFDSCPDIDHIVLVHRDLDTAEVAEAIRSQRLAKIHATTVGGATRTASEMAGLEVVRDLIASGRFHRSDIVLIHDGARPFLTHPLVGELVASAARHGGAIPGFAPPTAVARLGDDGRLVAADGASMRRVQTPQCFRAGELIDAYDAAAAHGFEGVDTAEVLAKFAPSGFHVAVVAADERNIKITVAPDLARAAQLARQWSPFGWTDEPGSATPSGSSSLRRPPAQRRAAGGPARSSSLRRGRAPNGEGKTN